MYALALSLTRLLDVEIASTMYEPHRLKLPEDL